MLTLQLTGVLPDGLPTAPGVPANTALALAAPAGADFLVELRVLRPSGQPAELAGAQCLLVLKRRPSDQQVVLARLGTAAAGGLARFRFVPQDTSRLEPGFYAYDVWVTDAEGRHQVVATSPFQLQQPVAFPEVAGSVPFFPPPSAPTGRIFTLAAPAAADASAVHAAHAASGADVFPGPVTSPDRPRSLTVTFGAGWDGGSVTVVGVDQFGAPVSEVFAPGAGSTVAGAGVFAAVASASKSAVGVSAAGASIGTGNKLGVPARLANADAILLVDNAAEPADVDVGRSAFTPAATAPDGAATYVLVANASE